MIEGNLLSGGTYSLYLLSTSKHAVGGDVSVEGQRVRSELVEVWACQSERRDCQW